MYLQAFHGLAVALVYKYADAIVKNFANSSVMALLIAISNPNPNPNPNPSPNPRLSPSSNPKQARA